MGQEGENGTEMSNALTRKKKKMQPLGYSREELKSMQRYSKAQSNANCLIEESYYNIRLMAYQIRQVYGWIRYYINSISTGYETVLGVASVLEQECKYIDKRFIGKTYKV